MSWLKEQIGDDWYKFLSPIIKSNTFKDHFRQVAQQYKKYLCYPSQDKIFRAFEETNFNEFHSVLLGQDVYPNGEGTGLCFDTAGKKFTPSLRMMYKAYSKEYPGNFNTKFMEGDLEHWAKQGILMLNTALTVQAGKANSHSGLWIYFRDKLFEQLNNLDRPLLFLAWGVYAQDIIKSKINNPIHKIIEASHPVAGVYSGKDWDSNNSFIEVEKWVKEKYNKEFNW